MTVVIRWLAKFLLWCLLISGGYWLITMPVVQAVNNQCDGTPYAGCETNRCCNNFVGLGVDDCQFRNNSCESTTTSTYTIPCDGTCTAIAPFPARCITTARIDPNPVLICGNNPNGNRCPWGALVDQPCECVDPTGYYQYDYSPCLAGVCDGNPNLNCSNDADCKRWHDDPETCKTCVLFTTPGREPECIPELQYGRSCCYAPGGTYPTPTGSTGGGGTQPTAPPGEPTYTPYPTPTPIINSPIGSFDEAPCNASAIWGWACDGDNFNQPLVIDIFVNGQWIGDTTANIVGSNPAVNALCGNTNTHYWTYTIPEQYRTNQDISIRAEAENIGSNGVTVELPGSPKTAKCQSYKTCSVTLNGSVFAPPNANNTVEITVTANSSEISDDTVRTFLTRSDSTLPISLSSFWYGDPMAPQQPSQVTSNGFYYYRFDTSQFTVNATTGTRSGNTSIFSLPAPIPPKPSWMQPQTQQTFIICNRSGCARHRINPMPMLLKNPHTRVFSHFETWISIHGEKRTREANLQRAAR